MPNPQPSPHRWSQITRLPLHAHIQTLAQYEEAVMLGNFDGAAFLLTGEPDFPPTTIQNAHHLLFRGVHPWAGEFRRPGQLATVAGYPAADPQRIVRELEMLEEQWRSMPRDTPIESLARISFGHVRFERIHPFLDGNGRCGRLLLIAQFERAFGSLPDFSDQRGYRQALVAANANDLAPFVRYLSVSLQLEIPSGAWPSPYRLAPRFLEWDDPNPSLEEDLQWSRLR